MAYVISPLRSLITITFRPSFDQNSATLKRFNWRLAIQRNTAKDPVNIPLKRKKC